MATIEYYDVILKPVVTEKSMNATEMALAVRKQFGDGDEIRDAMKQTFIIADFYDSSVKETTIFLVGDYGDTVCTFVSEVFESKDDAQEMYDGLVEEFEDVKERSGEDAEMKDFEEDGMVYTIINAVSPYTTCSYGVYLKDNTLFIVFCYGDKKALPELIVFECYVEYYSLDIFCFKRQVLFKEKQRTF